MSEDDEEPDEPQKTVQRLVNLCAALVGSDKNVVDTLYAIYGPDTNFPFPLWVEPKVQFLSKVDDLESKFKLALLLSNNATTSFSVSSYYDDEESDESKVLGPIVWKKLTSVCKKLQVVRAICTRNDEDYPEFCTPKFYHAELVLPAVLKMSCLQVLDVGETAFLDADLQLIGASLPQLQTLEFKFDGRVTKEGIQGLLPLKKLEDLLFEPRNEVLSNLEDYGQVIDNFMSRCLAILPWLKVLCSTVDSDCVFEHIMPPVEYGKVLSLEHLVLRRYLKANPDDYKEDPEMGCPFLRNVQFLKIVDLDNDLDSIKFLVDSEFDNVEELTIEDGCEWSPTLMLLRGIGKHLTKIRLDGCKGAWNILRILEAVPVATNVNISGGNGHYSFDDHDHLQHVSPNLVNFCCYFKNKQNCKLPPGVFARLLELSKLQDLTLSNLVIAAEDCNQVAVKIKSGVLKLQNFSTFWYHSGGEDSSFLVAVLCPLCPNFSSMEILGARGPFKEFVYVLSALLYPKIKLNHLL